MAEISGEIGELLKRAFKAYNHWQAACQVLHTAECEEAAADAACRIAHDDLMRALDKGPA
jgi:hypothetical protein